MSQGVTRLIEATVKFRKLAFVGLAKKYQGKVRGNPEDNEVIRAFVGTYSPAIYAYYSSYASAAIREEKRSHTVFKSARVAIGIAAGLFALTLMVWRPWSSLGSTKPTPAGSPSVPSIASGPSVQGSGSLLNPLGLAPSPSATPAPPKRTVRISVLVTHWLLDRGMPVLGHPSVVDSLSIRGNGPRSMLYPSTQPHLSMSAGRA